MLITRAAVMIYYFALPLCKINVSPANMCESEEGLNLAGRTLPYVGWISTAWNLCASHTFRQIYDLQGLLRKKKKKKKKKKLFGGQKSFTTYGFGKLQIMLQ